MANNLVRTSEKNEKNNALDETIIPAGIKRAIIETEADRDIVVSLLDNAFGSGADRATDYYGISSSLKKIKEKSAVKMAFAFSRIDSEKKFAELVDSNPQLAYKEMGEAIASLQKFFKTSREAIEEVGAVDYSKGHRKPQIKGANSYIDAEFGKMRVLLARMDSVAAVMADTPEWKQDVRECAQWIDETNEVLREKLALSHITGAAKVEKQSKIKKVITGAVAGLLLVGTLIVGGVARRQKRQIEDLQNQLTEMVSKEDYDNLKSDYDKIKGNNDKLSKERAELLEKLQAALLAQEQAETEKAKAILSAQTANEEKAKAQKELEEAKAAEEQAKKDAAAANEAKVKAEKERDDVLEKLAQQNTDDLQSQLSAAQAKLAAAEAAKAKAESDLNAAKSSKEKAERELKVAEGELQNAENTISNLESNVDYWKGQAEYWQKQYENSSQPTSGSNTNSQAGQGNANVSDRTPTGGNNGADVVSDRDSQNSGDNYNNAHNISEQNGPSSDDPEDDRILR